MKSSMVVLGAGISGLTAGWKLAESGHAVTILEQAPFPGGLAASVRTGGYSVDLGPHTFFTADPEVRDLIFGLFPDALIRLRRRVKFFYQGAFLRYPLSLPDLARTLGIGWSWNAFSSYLAHRFLPRTTPSDSGDESVPSWICRHFGAVIYETFFKPYTEQFWRIPAEALSIDSIPHHTRLSFRQTLASVFYRPGPGDLNLLEREKLEMSYPPNGFGDLAEALARRAQAAGARLFLSSTVQKIFWKTGETFTVRTREGLTHGHFNRLLSTLPIPDLAQAWTPSLPPDVRNAALSLEYRPLLILALATPRQNLLKGCQYLYFLHRPYNRISEMTRFSVRTCPPGMNLITLEIPASSPADLIEAKPEKILDRCRESLQADLGLDPREIEASFLIKASNAYPVYRLGYRKALGLTQSYFARFQNLHLLGRSAEFSYQDSDLCMRKALDLSREIVLKSYRSKTERHPEEPACRV